MYGFQSEKKEKGNIYKLIGVQRVISVEYFGGTAAPTQWFPHT